MESLSIFPTLSKRENTFPDNPKKHDVIQIGGIWYRFTGGWWTADTFATTLALKAGLREV